jgi:hypothetical protein
MSSYRTGVYVVDRRSNLIGRVMGNEGPNLQLRAPSGGREWDCPPGCARLATEREAGIAASGAEKAHR